MMTSSTSQDYERIPLTRNNSKVVKQQQSLLIETTTTTSSSSSSRSNSNNNNSRITIRRITCFMIVLVITAIALKKYPQFIQHNTHISDGDIIAKLDDSIITLPLHPMVETISGINHYYMIPNNATRGVLIYLHTCQQSGLELFHSPETRIVAYNALQQGLVVFAPTSYDRDNTGCYTNNDLERLPRIVNEFIKKQSLRKLPRIGIGDSSGGSFLFFIYKQLKLKSMAIYNSPQFYPEQDELDLAIPTVYITMAQDISMYQQIHNNYLQLKQQQSESTQLFKVSSRPFTESVCQIRLPELGEEFCQVVFHIIEKEFPNLLDNNGFIPGDTLSIQWEHCLTKLDTEYQKVYRKDSITLYDTSKAFNGKSWFYTNLLQEIRSCQGYHAMTAEYHDDILDFLISNANIVV